MWNRLPLVLREIVSPGQFKVQLLKYIWSEQVLTTDRHTAEYVSDVDDSV